MKKLCALALLALAMTSSAMATTVTFESYGEYNTPAGAGGISTWGNLYTVDGNTYMGTYSNAIVSGVYVLFNSAAQQAVISDANNFTFNSAYFTAIWEPQVDLQIRAYDNGLLKFSHNTTLNQTARNVILNFDDIDTLTIDSFVAGSLTQTWFGMDNAVVNGDVTRAVPEPASVALLGLGLAGMLAARRRRRAA